LPLEQTSPPPQVAPHDPQFFGSFDVLTHAPLQDVCDPVQLAVVVSPVVTSVDASGDVLLPLLALEQPTAVTVVQRATATRRCTTRTVTRLATLDLDMAVGPFAQRAPGRPGTAQIL